MPFNASGFFQRLFKWRDDRDAGIKILAERMDQEMDGIVDGINQVIQGQVNFNGPLVGVSGTVAAPAYSFTDEANTGVYRVSSGVLGFAVGGVKKAQLSSSGLDVSGDASFSGNVTGVTKSHVGLSNVDNTADVDKPVSTAQQAALNTKVSKIGDTMTGNLTFTNDALVFMSSSVGSYINFAGGGRGFAAGNHASFGQDASGNAFIWNNNHQWTFQADGNFAAPIGIYGAYLQSSGDIRAAGGLISGGNVVVGEGHTSSLIEMRDTDEGTRFLHNNSGTIGFLSNAGNWTFRVQDDGNFWSSMFGWASEWIVRDAENVLGVGLSSNTTPYISGNDGAIHWLADRGANCQHNSGTVEFGSIGVADGTSDYTYDLPAPYVMTGLREHSYNNGYRDIWLRGKILRNN